MPGTEIVRLSTPAGAASGAASGSGSWASASAAGVSAAGATSGPGPWAATPAAAGARAGPSSKTPMSSSRANVPWKAAWFHQANRGSGEDDMVHLLI